MIVTGQIEKSYFTSTRIVVPDYRKQIKIVHSQYKETLDYEEQLKKFIEDIVRKATDVQGIVKGLNTPETTIESSSSSTSLSNSTTDLCSTTSLASSSSHSVTDEKNENIQTKKQGQCHLAVFVLKASSNQHIHTSFTSLLSQAD